MTKSRKKRTHKKRTSLRKSGKDCCDPKLMNTQETRKRISFGTKDISLEEIELTFDVRLDEIRG